jgi:hypothetical protein
MLGIEFPKGDFLSHLSKLGGGEYDASIRNGLNQNWRIKSFAHSSELMIGGNTKIHFLFMGMIV